MVASGSWDKNVHLRDGSTGQQMWALRGHTEYVRSATFSQDGKLVMSGSNDRTIHAWNTSGNRTLSSLTGHTGDVRSVSLSHDGRFIVSGSYDKTARVWDMTSGCCLDTSVNLSKQVTSVKFHSINPLVIQLQVEGEIRYWTPSLPNFPPLPPPSDTLSTPLNQLTSYPRYSIEDRLVMVTQGKDQMPVPIGWLPPTFKVEKSDLFGNTMVMGGEGGEVFILKLVTL